MKKERLFLSHDATLRVLSQQIQNNRRSPTSFVGPLFTHTRACTYTSKYNRITRSNHFQKPSPFFPQHLSLSLSLPRVFPLSLGFCFKKFRRPMHHHHTSSSSAFNPRSELAEFPVDNILVFFDFCAVFLRLFDVEFDQKHQRHEHEDHDDQEPGSHGTGEAQGRRDDQASDPRE